MAYVIIGMVTLCIGTAMLGAFMLLRVVLARAPQTAGLARFNIFSSAFHNHAVETGNAALAKKGQWLFLAGLAGAILAFPFLLVVKPLLEN
ncbi:MAG: hypothetical protein AAGK38_00755 [Pseudomonadota bacterium]